ncbi:hypothetical protein TNCV_3097941 [Trichonephila clavipes]|nr:hypothetical protein TNCV_3097941 [Trichonephila clavipes]
MDGSQISCSALRALALNSREQLIRQQMEDPELGHIYRYLENSDDGSVNATVCEKGAEYVRRNIEKLFDEGRQNMRKQQKNWENTIGKGGKLTSRDHSPLQGSSHPGDSRQDKPPTEGSRHEGSGQYDKTRETRTTKNGTNRAAERRSVRSKQATSARPCPYYLRSRVRQPEGFPEERRNIGIESIPQNNIRRKSLSM